MGRVLSNSYIFEGQHYMPGPGGHGVVNEHGVEVALPAHFPLHLRHDVEGAPPVPDHLTDGAPSTSDFEFTIPKDADLDAMTVDELTKVAAAYGLTVQGTGSNGKVLKADLISAITVAANKE